MKKLILPTIFLIGISFYAGFLLRPHLSPQNRYSISGGGRGRRILLNKQTGETWKYFQGEWRKMRQKSSIREAELTPPEPIPVDVPAEPAE